MFAMMRKFWLLLLLAVASIALGGVSLAEQGELSLGENAVMSVGKSGKCVGPTAVMRREHMDFLLEQRDKTMRHGIRGGDHALKKCIDCHEDLKRGEQGQLVSSDRPISVNDPRDGFCQTCHQFAAVRIDCFQCHVAVSDAVTSE
uniref:Uncharacterized protein n=1 Tax=Candidatus Kentrum sp. DK TaxID=2126562 RepID=A0A450RTH4_9GAMM|nr:MAG: hypothetical protein BECKDK2373B_GA0170837_100125 [Candidatus Kentron sp. DK]